MRNGKKNISTRLLKKVFLKVYLRGFKPMNILLLAVLKVKPVVNIRFVFLRGKLFQVPFPLVLSKQITLAIKNILKFSRTKKNITDSIVEEIIFSAFGQSQSVKDVLISYKQVSQNRIFTHYRWF